MKTDARLRIVCTAVVIPLLAAIVSAEHWPQWRGPAGNGVSNEADLPTTWDKETNVAWRVDLPESGNSSPVVWDDRIFITQPVSAEKMRTLICFRKSDGEKLWQKGVKYEDDEASHRTNPYCSPSPATDGERVIVWFGSAGIICYDMDGNKQWEKKLGPLQHMWGYGTSPLIHENLCILNFGPGANEALVALDKETGDEVWRVKPLALDDELELSSSPANDGNVDPARDKDELDKKLRGAWSTPILEQIGDQMQLIVSHPRRVSAYDPATGEVQWTCGGYAPLAYTSPMRSGKSVMALGGYFGASIAVDADGQGDVTDSKRLWHKKRESTNWLGTGVVRDGHLYICDMGGVAYCFEFATGKEIWKSRLPGVGAKGACWSSLTMTGDGVIYLMTQKGDVFVFRASPEGYEGIARNRMGEDSNSTVAVSDGKLIIRTFDALWCIGS